MLTCIIFIINYDLCKFVDSYGLQQKFDTNMAHTSPMFYPSKNEITHYC